MSIDSNGVRWEHLEQFCRKVVETPETPDLISLVASETLHIQFCREIIKPDKKYQLTFEAFCKDHNLSSALIRQRLELTAAALGVDHKENHFEILGVAPDADERAIKKAYREKARLYHPDRNNGDIENSNRFVELHAAYMHLSDPDMRRQYAQLHGGSEGWTEGEKPPELKVRGDSFGHFFSWLCVFIGVVLIIAFGYDLYQNQPARLSSQESTVKDQTDDPAGLLAANDDTRPLVSQDEDVDASAEPGEPAGDPDGQSPVMSDADTGDEEFLFYDPNHPMPYQIERDDRYDNLDAALASLASQYNRDPGWVKTFRGGENDWSAIHRNLSSQLTLEDEAKEQLHVAVNDLSAKIGTADPSAEEAPSPGGMAEPVVENSSVPEIATLKMIPMPNQPKAVKTVIPIAKTPPKKVAKAKKKPNSEVKKKRTPPAVTSKKKRIAKATKPNTAAVAAKPVTKASPDREGTDISHALERFRVLAFLENYTRIYESKDLDRFKAFFTKDAMEQGKAFDKWLPTYQKTFNRIEELKYDIDLTSFSKEEGSKKIFIEGLFTAQYRLPDKTKWGRSSGSVRMELVDTPSALMVRRLNYEMNEK